MLMIEAKEKVLKRGSFIHYLVQFKKDSDKIWALIDSRSKVNVMASAYTKKLGLWMQKTNVGTQKIDGLTLETYGIVIASFLRSKIS